MKKRTLRSFVLGLSAVASVLPAVGCSHTQVGTGVGAVGGALVGSAVAGRGKGAQGALIGAGAGALAGGLLGASEDRAERRAVEAHQARMVTVNDVISLTQAGTPADVIVNQIRTTGSVYTLTAHDLVTLQNSGVAPAVVREMQDSGRRRVMPTRTVVVHEPPPVVYVQPAPPPPPPGFGVGVMIRR
ncbi:MAG: glycine zipper domain-containing protein [Gemmataceae bacterium]